MSTNATPVTAIAILVKSFDFGSFKHSFHRSEKDDDSIDGSRRPAFLFFPYVKKRVDRAEPTNFPPSSSACVVRSAVTVHSPVFLM
jgi:hypothetical protein